MSTALTDMREALYSGILAAAGSIHVEWENKGKLDPPELLESHICVDVNPTKTASAMGIHAYEEHTGILLLTIYSPLDMGTSELTGIADQLRDTLHRGAVFTSNGVSVRIERFQMNSIAYQKAWASMPISIYWHSYIPS